MDGDLFRRLEKQINSPSSESQPYTSPKWAEDKFLNSALRQRVVELAEQSGNMGKNGYDIKQFASGRFAGEKGVCFNNKTAWAKRLLPLIKSE